MAQPSLTALQTWLQLSDDLLATAWGTMDRYHLSWLMVGKPKGIVRGREMTADEEAAYVREVAEQKTAALRMSLDAVERQGMPFRGETGGVGAGQGMGEVRPARPTTPRDGRTRTRRDLAALDPARPGDAAPARRGPPSGGRARRPRAGRHAPRRHATRSSSDDPRHASRPSAARATSRRRTTSPATTSCSASASTSTCPGPSTATSGRPSSRRRVDMEQLRSPARLADDAADLRARLPGEVVAAGSRDLARSPAGRDRDARPRRGRRADLRTSTRSSDASRSVRRAGRTPCSSGRARAGRRCSRATAASPTGSRPRTPPGPSDPARVSAVVDASCPAIATCAASHVRAPGRRRPRVSLVRDQPWTGYNWYDGGYRSRVDFNLDLPIRLPRSSASIAHETYPGHHLEHATKEAVLVESCGHLEASCCSSTRPSACSRRASRTSAASSSCRPRRCRTCSLELAPVAGLPMAGDPGAIRAAAARQGAIEQYVTELEQQRT